MASSQVEIASSSPFGCVLRDHNQRDRYRESNARAASFQKNLTDLVRDHLHSCISISSSSSSSDENSQRQSNNHDSRITHEQRNNRRSLRFIGNNTNSNINNREESSGIISSRQSQILDRWAATQAREMVSSIERQTHEAELLALSNPHSVSSSPSTALTRENSLANLSNVGASSLVQIWEARLNRSNSFNLNSTVNRTYSGLSNTTENAATVEEEPSRGSQVCDSADERFEPQAINEDNFGDSDAGESERIRVADIIRRLTLANPTQTASSTDDNNDHEQPISHGLPPLPFRERNHASVSNHAEQIRERPSGFEQRGLPEIITLPQIRGLSSAFDGEEKRGFSHLVNSPRLRGRQAFNDLLMQMERDRQGELDTLVERGAVSRFPQRGRIQSLLRLRLLQRDHNAHQDQQQSHSTASELNRPQGSIIMLLRERFNTGVEHGGVTAQSREASLRSSHGETAIYSQDLGNSSTLNRLISEDNHYQEADTTEQHSTSSAQHSTSSAQHLESYASEDLHEEASLISDVTWQETNFEASNLDIQEAADNGWDGNVTAEEQEDNNQQLIGTNYDWLSDISRPREYWESRRQEWYQEMLDTNPHNEEIRQLLERRRVSTFLSSDFRDRMDQLMMSHLHRQTHLVGSQEEEEQDEVGNQETMDQLMSFLRRHTHQLGSQEEEEEEMEEVDEEDEEEEEEAEESLIGYQYHDVSDYFNVATSPMQMPFPSLMNSWSSYQDHEVGDDSNQTESTSLRQRLPSQSYYQDTRKFSSSMNRPSIEMELMYDLRGHIEQLHREMSELRKSMKSCMNMQMKLQHSIKQEAHSVGGEEKNSVNRVRRRGSCCICYEMQVDSLLYRCGHMCTCLKCAHELQWSSGKCPICRAPIVDVVRAYAGS